MLYSTGKFSRICRISPKTLRYYESIGLLLPDSVNMDTGYRYYSSSRVYEINAIEEFKKMGFSLKEIGSLLKSRIPAEREKLVDEKILELKMERQKLNSSLEKLEGKKEMITGGIEDFFGMRRYEVKESTQYETTVLSERATIRMEHIADFIDGMFLEMFRKNLKPNGAVRTYYYDVEFDPENADLEVCIPVSPNSAAEGLKIIKPCKTAFTTYRGAYLGISGGYAAVIDYIEKNSYEVSGVPYEKYLIGYESGLDEEEYVTEIHFPIG